jgi:uracil-DNA glycosylase
MRDVATWLEVILGVSKKPQYASLVANYNAAISLNPFVIHPSSVCPAPVNRYRSLKETPLSEVKVVILGQEPYCSPGLATGLAFGGVTGLPRPPALRNIIKELKADLSVDVDTFSNSLVGWARQGVLLLNTCLSVEEGKPMSHSGIGWDVVVDAVLGAVNAKKTPVVFMLWGEAAVSKKSLIGYNHHVLLADNPSTATAYRFFGCHHFSQTNQCLINAGVTPIDWTQID